MTPEQIEPSGRRGCVRSFSLVLLAMVVVTSCGGAKRPQTAEIEGKTVPVVRRAESECDDTGACAPPPYEFRGSLYQVRCDVVPPDRLADVVGVGEGPDISTIRGTADGGLAARRTAACPHAEGEWVSLVEVAQ